MASRPSGIENDLSPREIQLAGRKSSAFSGGFRLVKHFWRLFKDTAVYGFGKGILFPLGLITLPIFTRVFGPDEFGVIELIITITSLLSLFLIVGMDSATTRSYFDASTSEHKREVISSGFWFLVVWNLLVVGVVLLFSGRISSLAFGSGQYANLLKIVFVNIPLSLLVAYCQNTIRLQFSPWRFTAVALLSGLSTVGLSLLLVLEFRMGLWGYFIGILAGNAISLMPALYLSRKDLALAFSPTKLKEMLRYGVPLVPASLAYYVFSMSDRFFLARFATLADVGLYSVAVKISSIMLFFNMAFGLAWSPFVFKLYAESEERMKEIAGRTAKYVLVFFSLMAVSVTAFSPELLRLVTTEQYFGAAIAIAPLCLGGVAYATTQVTVLGISLARKTKYIALFSWVAATVNLGLNALLVPRFGILGASIANAVSYAVLTLCYYAVSQKLYHVAFDRAAILKICLICLLFVIAATFIVFDNLVLGIFVKLAFILLFGAVIFPLRIFDAQETAYIKGWFSGFRKVRHISDLRTWIRNQRGGKN